MTESELPAYDELPRKGALAHSWGLWGPEDVSGTLNLLNPERVRAALAHVVEGKAFPLDWDAEQPDPPMFGRKPFTTRQEQRSPTSQDETIDNLNTQSTTQWDGFRHVKSVAYGFYNGLSNEQHGVGHWAQRGLAGRAVLVDVGRWLTAVGRPLVYDESIHITVADLEGALEAQGSRISPGDFLLVRTGWITWYEQQSAETKAHIAIRGNLVCPGLARDESMARFLWDSHVAAVAVDNPAMEAWPLGSEYPPEVRAELTNDPLREHLMQLHVRLLPMLGIPIGELFYLDALAEHCAEVGRYEMLFTSAPMRLLNGLASPPNAVALL